jgi:hypothetical protein
MIIFICDRDIWSYPSLIRCYDHVLVASDNTVKFISDKKLLSYSALVRRYCYVDLRPGIMVMLRMRNLSFWFYFAKRN